MQAVKLSIPGEYWDSYIYEGILYLFLLDGSISSYRWDAVSNAITIPGRERLAFEIAFQRSDFLYSETSGRLIRDEEVNRIVIDKFSRLARRELVVDGEGLRGIAFKTQENLLPFPHAGMEIYGRTMYVASTSGVHKAKCSKQNKNLISKRPRKVWDCPSLSISANYGNLAIAAGEEGLYELEVRHSDYVSENRFLDPTLIASCHVSQVDWNYYSIAGSSHLGGGVLAIQNMNEDGDVLSAANLSATRRRSGSFGEFSGRVVAPEGVFGSAGYMWGGRDKLYQARPGEIAVLRFNPFDRKRGNVFTRLEPIRIEPWKGEVVSAKVASFGTILELDEAVVVIRSDGVVDTIPGEPVQWRVFARSKHYENQLHILYEDRLDVYSFNHDALVNQAEKTAGYAYAGR